MASQQLPEDMLIEILIRLPLKSIQRFKCVSKSWFDLIRSSVFIDRHQKHDKKQSVLLVKRYLQDGGKDVFSFHDPDFPDVLVSPDLSIPIPDYLNKSTKFENFKVHGPCNGLVCVALCETVFLCNPALREFRLLPPLIIVYPKGYRADVIANGFGFDPNTGAYKVVQFWGIGHRKGSYQARSKYPLNHTLRTDLYNSTSNSWKQIDPEFPQDRISWLPCFELFFNNAIHWCVRMEAETYEVRILCFDTSTEAFRLMDVPDDFDKIFYYEMSLMVLNESLAMVFHQREGAHLVDIWVMNEYGVKESWTKQLVIGPYCIGHPLLCLRDEWLLCEENGGQLVACALHENHFKEFGLHGYEESLRAIVYEESLIRLEMLIP